MNQNSQTNGTNNTVNYKEDPLFNQRKAHVSRSEKYSVVTTADIIEQFEKAGFEWKMGPKQKVRKNSSYSGFETHTVLFQHPDIVLGDEQLKSELKPQIYFRNSYDGRSRLQFDLGLIKFSGLTGLVLGNMFKHKKRKHIGLEDGEVAEMVKKLIVAYSEDITRFILALKERMMTKAEMLEFAKRIVAERFRDSEGFKTAQYELLIPESDTASLWDTLIAVQERIGLNYRKIDEPVYYTIEIVKEGNVSELKQRKIRRLSDIREVTHLNKFLFDVALEYAPNSIAEELEVA
jgi:hypothetical protein